MPTTTYMVITDQTGAIVPGESTASVRNPYTNSAVAFPVELSDWSGSTENAIVVGGGGGSGKIVFNPFTITKKIDKTSQTLFLTQATGRLLRFVDILVVKTNADGSAPRGNEPFLAYRLGTVGISEISSSSDDESPRESVSFVFGQFQIGYRIQKADGSLTAFAPAGWDRVRNVQI